MLFGSSRIILRWRIYILIFLYLALFKLQNWDLKKFFFSYFYDSYSSSQFFEINSHMCHGLSLEFLSRCEFLFNSIFELKIVCSTSLDEIPWIVLSSILKSWLRPIVTPSRFFGQVYDWHSNKIRANRWFNSKTEKGKGEEKKTWTCYRRKKCVVSAGLNNCLGY